MQAMRCKMYRSRKSLSYLYNLYPGYCQCYYWLGSLFAMAVLNKIKLWLEFCYEKGVYKYDESMINVAID